MKTPAFVPRLLPLLIAASLLPVTASAEDASPLMTIVVTGTPEVVAPAGVVVEDLPSLRATTSDTASLLRDVPGVSLYGAGGVSSLPSIHGLADDRLRIKVDGMDLISACGNHMNPALSYIDPSNVESIQVFSGLAPVSSGGDSIGGTILVDSAAPEFAKAGEGVLKKGEAGAFYRSNGNAFGGNLSATIASDTVSVTYSGSTAESDNYKAGGDFKPAGLVPNTINGSTWLDGDEVGSSAYKSRNQSLGFAMRHENHLVELKLGVQDIPYQGFPNQRMDMTSNESEQVNLRYKGQYDWGTLEARAYNEDTRHKMNFMEDKEFWYYTTKTLPPGTPVPAAGMPMDTEGRNSGAVVKGDIQLSARDTLRVGGEYQRYRFSDWWDPSGGGMWPDTFLSINDGERDRLAAFGEWEAQWNPQWLTQFGLRYEKVDMDTGEVQGYNANYTADATAFNNADRQKTDHNIDLTALARFTPTKTQTIEFGYARKTRSPNLYERYSWSTGGMAMSMINMVGDGNGYVGNLDLEPEVAHTLSATAGWHDAAQENWGLKVTPYYTYVQDYINAELFSTTSNGYVYLKYVNQDAQLYGLDVSGYFPLAKNTSYGSFTATGILNYVKGETTSGTEDNLYNIMPLNAKLAVVQRQGRWTNTAEVELVDAKDDVSQIRKELETAGYGLLNLRSSYAWKQARLDVGIENVFDRLYDLPLGGAYVGQGRTMSAGAGWPYGYAVPGMGRSIYTALTFKF
ncbi:MAG TPA: TonB-dependent receptor [Thiobacillus sp.]|nr:TonB-dependent receptor [Thiobacillus sp.]